MKQIVFLFLVFAFLSCEQENYITEPLNIREIGFSECDNDSTVSSCLLLQAIDDSYLLINHQKTMFCCGTEEIDIRIENRNDTIVIHEIDLGPYTWCYCWHDITFKIGPFKSKQYTMQLIGCETSYNRDSILIDFQYSDNLFFLICK
ncbi:MAG: hypothetical protein ABFS10_11415 [Bacteroidota bacterium]